MHNRSEMVAVLGPLEALPYYIYIHTYKICGLFHIYLFLFAFSFISIIYYCPSTSFIFAIHSISIIYSIVYVYSVKPLFTYEFYSPLVICGQLRSMRLASSFPQCRGQVPLSFSPLIFSVSKFLP
jgi:hypothetical protein